MARALTPKQQRFVEEYLVDCNASAAALRAGYKHEDVGRQLLTKTHVQSAIAAAQAARSQRTAITQDWVVEQLRQEATRLGEGSSHSARITALKLLGDHVGLWAERPPLEALLAALPAELAVALRGALAARLAAGGPPAGGSPGQAAPPAG